MTSSLLQLATRENISMFLSKKACSHTLNKEEFAKGLLKEGALKEARYMKYLEGKLRILNKEAGNIYQEEEISEICKTAESFNKKFQEESRRVWKGITDELSKHGANQSFIEGMEKEALDIGKIYQAIRVPIKKFIHKNRRGSTGKFRNPPPGAQASQAQPQYQGPSYTPPPINPTQTQQIGAAPGAAAGQAATDADGFGGWLGKGAKGLAGGAGTGAMIGSFMGAPWLGALAGAGLGGAYGLGGGLGAAALGLGVPAYLGYKGLDAVGLLGRDKEKRDISGELEDRNRIVPFLSNKGLGAVGGALLGNLIAGENNMGGLLLPVLGGVAGYNYLPQMMNKWKDPLGVGANSINPMSVQQNMYSMLNR